MRPYTRCHILIRNEFIKNTIDCLPISIALLTLDGSVIQCNEVWQKNISKFSTQSIFTATNETWPSNSLSNKQLLKDILNTLQSIKIGTTNPPTVRSSFVFQGYQHKVFCTINVCAGDDNDFIVVSISILMDGLSGTNKAFQLRRDETMVLNSLSEGVVIQDAHGVITANNPASETILGITSAQMRGLDGADPLWGTITSEGKPCPPEQQPSCLAIATGKPVYDFIMGVNGPEGSVRWLKMNSQPVFAEGATKPHVTVSSFIDITQEKLRQKTLVNLSERLQLALHTAQSGIWEYDSKIDLLTWDEATFSIFDISPDAFNSRLSDFVKIIHDDDRQSTLEAFTNALRNKKGVTLEFRIVDSKNNIKHVYSAAEVILGENGESDILIGINRDISPEIKAKKQLEKSRNELLQFISGMPVAVFSVIDNQITINQRGELVTGFSNTELLTVSDFFRLLFDGDLQVNPDFYESVTRKTNLQAPSTMQISRKDDALRWVTFEGCQLGDRQAWVMIDVTEQILAEEGLKKLAFFDSLSGLPNRNSVEQQVVQMLDEADSEGTKLGLLVIDLDSFKNVNDTYGHIVGDHLLQRVSKRLKKRVRACDIIGRIGGDEFMVIVRQLSSEEELIEIANNFINAFNTPVVLVNDVQLSLNVTITVGASCYPEHGTDYVRLFRNADTALYNAKAMGKNRAQIYKKEFTQALQTQLKLEQNIEKAIEEEAFSLYFQPIVDCSSNQILSAECLMRWIDPEAGFIAPDQFICAAESTGQIVRLGKWVIQKSFKEFVRWQQNGIELNYLAINLSPVQFNDSSLIKVITNALAETGVKPEKIVLEITEGMLVHNQTHTKKILQELKRLGIRLAIDDFGTGYSSLAYLKDFDVDILKIDRSFIMDIPGSATDVQIAGAIISMAKDLNLKVVAEGVETSDQLEFLREHNCNTYQGYFKSPAVCSEDFIALYKQDLN